MDTTIYYFSATGNSLQVAKTMAAIQEVELLSMPAHRGAVCNSKAIGFVFLPIFGACQGRLRNLSENFVYRKNNRIFLQLPHMEHYMEESWGM